MNHAYAIREDTELILDLEHRIFGQVVSIDHGEQEIGIAVLGSFMRRGESFIVDFETCHLLLDRQEWMPLPEEGVEVNQYCDYGARVLPPPETN